MCVMTTQTTMNWNLVDYSCGIQIELDACYPGHLTNRGWKCVMSAPSIHRAHQEPHAGWWVQCNSERKGQQVKIKVSGLLGCWPVLGEGNIWVSRTGIGSWFFTRQVGLLPPEEVKKTPWEKSRMLA